MAGPDSSYSALEIHMDWNVDSDERMEPPIQGSTVRPAARGLLHQYPPSQRRVQCRMRLNRASLPRTVHGTGQMA